MERRTLLRTLVYGMGLTVGGIVTLPAIISSAAPAIRYRPRPRWEPLGQLDRFPVGKVRQAVVNVSRDDWAEALRRKGVYVWRVDAQQTVVYSRNCTDLSCPITFDQGSEVFFCPCHGGIFAKDGQVMAGPPSRPLYRYDNRVRNGVLEINLASLPPMT
ncbi:ubiquinol-cytochrome c reductase iron-sulfur subunit [Phycisphaerales bacterium AB-hyl4]|uniref:Ubiquinol-cytochrome c reductase iron-sulfur subunit n=1 Tax=Natronomicrosphaera hydrolytica TaxID=3242702 RepID=A0ABV4U1B1_9BACT